MGSPTVVRRSLIALSWACLAAILFFTLASANERPHIFPFPSLDRLFAFAAMAFLFGIAYPQHLVTILSLIIAAAIGLELLQYVFPTRDPRFFDAVAKVLGSVVGVLMARGAIAILGLDPRRADAPSVDGRS